MSTISAGTTSTTTLIATGDTTGSLVLKTNDTGSGGTTAMTIDTSQNVGIGTSSPTYRLDAISTGGTQTARFRSGDTATTVDIASFERSDSAVRAVINYNSSDGAMTYGTSTNHPIAFKTNNTERMRIDTSGNLLVGTTGAITVAGVGGTHSFKTTTANKWVGVFQTTDASTPWGIALNYSGGAPNNTTQDYIYCYDTAPRFSVRSNGGVANYSGNNVNLSDRREKTNFAPAKSYLDVICQIPVQTFNYIDQNMEEDPGLTLGVVAQDVQAVAPELVMESNWGTEEEPKMRLSIYQTDLQYALMKCIQEQQALITQLTERISALENK